MTKAKYNKPFLTRAREAFGVLRGTHRPAYRLQDLAKIVDHVAKVEKARRRGMGFHNEYKSGGEGRLREDWSVATDTPSNELRSRQIKIVARSRDLFKNDTTYRNAIHTMVNNCVGTGLWPKPKIRDAKGNLRKDLNKKIERLFWIYSNPEEWDARRKMPFVGEGQRAALKNVILSGDNFLNAVNSQVANSLLPISWQMFEIDRLDATRDTYGSLNNVYRNENIKQTCHGINIGEYGEEVSYNILGLTKPIPARNIIHSCMTDRPEQYIGVPAAVAGLTNIYDAQELIEDYSLKSRAIAKLLWFFSEENLDSPGEDDKDEDDVTSIEPLTQMRGKTAPEKLSFPDNVNDTFGPMIKILQRGLCSGMGTSYSSVTRDMEGVNYAASQSVGIQDWIFYTVLRDWFNYEFNRPYFNKALEGMIVKRLIPEISVAEYIKEPWVYRECEWVGNGRMSVDPLKDVTADIEGLKSGLFSLNDVISKRGKDRDDHLDELEQDALDLKARNLTLNQQISSMAGTLVTQESK